MKTIYFLLPLSMLLFNSCSPTLSHFTQDLYEENNWSIDELRQIQFYLSNDIVLRREVTSGEGQILDGKIRIRDGRKVEEIVIQHGTPGVFLYSPKENRFAVSFEKNDDNHFLMFGPNPKAGDRYVLLASEWDRRQGKVTYDHSTWWVDGDAAFAGLMVDLKRSRQVSVKSRAVQGRTVN
ncbi:MAG: Uma2 family endonuclease [Saprospirales bacterium]|nr:Uma2 family endonuclease [Saprospirales bacterium]MBK8489540.1 Uma2 family endonuclease [Saprospirales bacterium]